MDILMQLLEWLRTGVEQCHRYEEDALFRDNPATATVWNMNGQIYQEVIDKAVELGAPLPEHIEEAV